jgi:hypothetical protein
VPCFLLPIPIEEKEKLMIETYFARPSTLNRLHSGPIGSDLDDLATALQQQGYAWLTFRTLFYTAAAIFAEPPVERRVGAISRPF